MCYSECRARHFLLSDQPDPPTIRNSVYFSILLSITQYMSYLNEKGEMKYILNRV